VLTAIVANIKDHEQHDIRDGNYIISVLLTRLTRLHITEDKQSVLNYLMEMRFPVVVRSSIDDLNVSALMAGVKLLSALVVSKKDEEWLHIAEGLYKGHTMLSFAKGFKGS